MNCSSILLNFAAPGHRGQIAWLMPRIATRRARCRWFRMPHAERATVSAGWTAEKKMEQPERLCQDKLLCCAPRKTSSPRPRAR